MSLDFPRSDGKTSPLSSGAGSSSLIYDNQVFGKAGSYLFDKIRPNSQLSFVTAYFTIYAYERLREKLDSIEELRLLFGEPTFLKSVDPDKTAHKAFHLTESGLKVANQLQQRYAAKLCANWIRDKVQIRSVKQANLLHGKMYHIDDTDALIGSSNFTAAGLGLGMDSNIELNIEVDAKSTIRDLKKWFDTIWNDKNLVEDVKDKVLEYLSVQYADHSPEFIYYKTLFHLFENFLAENEEMDPFEGRTSFLESKIWNALFQFQKDGAKGAIQKIIKYNGCILADSVGLGKTYEALAVIKYFLNRNERVLVLCPKKLRENWTIYDVSAGSTLNPFMEDRMAYTVLSHTDLGREKGHVGTVDLKNFRWDDFDLIVIDESHNFRNTGQRYDFLFEKALKSGGKTKVLLLSATPVNTSLRDLRNQLDLITEQNDEAFQESLGIRSIKSLLGVCQRTFEKWAKVGGERRISNLLNSLDGAFLKLLDEVTIARSRKHVVDYYSEELDRIGRFPKREKPKSIYPKIDTKDAFVSYEKIAVDITGLKMALYYPAFYLKDEFKPQYETTAGTKSERNLTQEGREKSLTSMMKVNLLKRLESSVEAFRLTLGRTVESIERLEATLRNAKEIELATFEADPANDDEEVQEALEVGKNKKYKTAHMRLDDWLRDLESDRVALQRLYDHAQPITPARDAKLADLKSLIKAKMTKPTMTEDGRKNKKVLVFTASADTAQYLFANLRPWVQEEFKANIAVVTGTGDNHVTTGHTEFNEILTNFSPIAKRRSEQASLALLPEIDVLIATDCISEGQNLQDCDYLVNYDIHWNPVRIIQRFGRIDRIGSRNQSVQLVNFWPTHDLNAYINLKDRVESRMALVDLTATSDDNMLTMDAIEESVQQELDFRDRALLQLKDSVLDLEDLDDGVSLTEFTLDDFRVELLRFFAENRKALEEAPPGLFAVVPSEIPPDKVTLFSSPPPKVFPGVIFCLKQRVTAEENAKINPLQPYFLIYVRDDGEVRFNFSQPKQILELYRLLSTGKTSAYEELCRTFDKETEGGKNMAKHSELLSKSLRAIERSFSSRAVDSLFSSKQASLPNAKDKPGENSDWELVTWLVIR